MRLLRITAEPQQEWYLTCKRTAFTIARAMGRIVSPEHDVVIELVTTDPPLSGLNGGDFWQHPAPWVVDRSTQTRRRRPQPYSGTIITLEELQREAGRGHLFTPGEKRKTYAHHLQHLIPNEYHVHLAPLIDLVFMNRSELPFGRWMQRERKLKESP